MNYYGLHWTSDDDRPLQVRITSKGQEVWARSCPNGAWTLWRRLDVSRNSDGLLNETCLLANNAKLADAASRLARAVNISLAGAINGSCLFDGANNVIIETTADAIMMRIGSLEHGQANLQTGLASLRLDTQSNAANITNLQAEIANINGKVSGGQDTSADLTARLANLEARLQNLETGNGSFVDSARETLEDLKSRVSELELEVYRLGQYHYNGDY